MWPHEFPFQRIPFQYCIVVADILEWDGFILDESELVPTGRETWAGVAVVVEQVMNDHGKSLRGNRFRLLPTTLAN